MINIYWVYIMFWKSVEVAFVERAKIFFGRHRAVRLPQQFRGSDVFVKRVGKVLPIDDAWDPLAKALTLFSDDYMAERHQPSDPEPREDLY